MSKLNKFLHVQSAWRIIQRMQKKYDDLLKVADDYRLQLVSNAERFQAIQKLAENDPDEEEQRKLFEEGIDVNILAYQHFLRFREIKRLSL